MASPSTPRHKRLAIPDTHNGRSTSTPPATTLRSKFLAPLATSPSSRHSSPGNDRLWNGRRYADDMIPRQLTASPVPLTRPRDKTRKRLVQYHSINHAVDLLKSAKNIVVLSGAGISTALDIPDFRSDGGFYTKLSSSIGLTTPEEFFSLDFFKRESESFWDNVKPLLPKHVRTKDGTYQYVASKKSDPYNSTPRYSKTHAFLALLHAEDKLLTNYTQNVDSLEFASGIRSDKIVQCHGTWDTATCLTCKKAISAKKYIPIVWENGYPRCSCAATDLPKELKSQTKKKVKKRKRAIYEGDSDHDSDDGTSTPRGLFKPDITFFGEEVPQYYIPRLEHDKVAADLLLVFGTSLRTRPVKAMVTDFPPHVPQIWINRERFSGYKCDMPGVQLDIELLGECDVVVEELCRRAAYPLHDFLWTDHHAGGKSISKEHNTKDSQFSTIAIREKERDAPDDSNMLSIPSSATVVDPSGNLVPQTNLQIHVTDFETDQKPLNAKVSSPALSEKVVSGQNEKVDANSNIRVDSDLDAEWRWRFTTRPVSPAKR